MDARFGEQHAVRVITLHDDRGALDAGFVARLKVDHVALEAAALGPSQVHAEQHLGPVLRLGAAGPGMDRHDRVLAVVFAAQHLLGLAGIDERGEIVQAGREIVRDGLPGLRPFEQHRQVLDTASQRLAEVAILFEPAPALLRLLRGGLVLPEVGGADPLFYLGEFFRVAGGVKDSSADRRRVAPGPRICEAVRRSVAGPSCRYSIACGAMREAPPR
jgi:hypothetical protein